MNALSQNSSSPPRRIPVRWLDHEWTPQDMRRSRARISPRFASAPPAGRRAADRWPSAGRHAPGSRRWQRPGPAAFTVLEMLVVVTIIGIMAAMALPHLSGMSKANSMTVATQQLVNDVNLARQLAISHRTTVYMVFNGPGPSGYPGPPQNESFAYSNLLSHEYSAYAVVSLRSVGDQPGRGFPQYLTSWKMLPSGVFLPTYMFGKAAASLGNYYTTNTLSRTVNTFGVSTFNAGYFPFPAADALYSGGSPQLPCIGFNAMGQLTTNSDLFIPLALGALINLPTGIFANENPANNSYNNPNLIHIDWLTGKAKIERNQF